MKCENCGDEIDENAPAITTSAGWCMSSEVFYDLPVRKECGDCKARFAFALEFGFDPGRNGENLKVSRGGIQYTRPE